jgi:hypothetical protein
MKGGGQEVRALEDMVMRPNSSPPTSDREALSL